MPLFGPGDLLEVSYYHSLGTKQSVTVKGVCIARFKPNSYESSFNILNVTRGAKTMIHFKMYSPLMIEIKVVRYGGTKRNKLYYLMDLPLNANKAVRKGASKRERVTKLAKEEAKKLRYLALQQKKKTGLKIEEE